MSYQVVLRLFIGMKNVLTRYIIVLYYAHDEIILCCATNPHVRIIPLGLVPKTFEITRS